MTDNLTEISLEYAEFGKIFNYPGRTSDYRVLNRSHTRLANILMDKLYNPNIANYAVTRGLPFALKPPGYGNFTVVLQPLPSVTNDLLFIQLQQRTELDYVIKQGLELPGRGIANRAYTQAHITLLPQHIIEKCFRDNIAIYESLLFGREGQFALEDYGITSPRSSVYEPREIPRYVPLKRSFVSFPDPDYVRGITNLLIRHYQSVSDLEMWQQSRLKKTVFVIPELGLSQKLAIIQEVQKRLYPLLGIISFALDYAITPESQVYLCNDEPASFYLNRSDIYSSRQIKAATNLDRKYRDVYEISGYEYVLKSEIPKYFRKGSPLEEAITINELINDHEALDWNAKISEFIKCFSRIDGNDISKILENIAINSDFRFLLDEIFKTQLHVEQRKFLYTQVLAQLIRKFPVTISKFIDGYLAIKANEVESKYLERYLLNAIKTYPELVLEMALTNSDGALLYELLIINKHERILIENNEPLEKIMFEKPSKALYNAITRLNANNSWTVDYQDALYEVLSNPNCAWTDDEIGKLIEASKITLPNLGLHRLKALLDSTLPNNIKAERLQAVIKGVVQEGISLFKALNQQNLQTLRDLAITVCNSNDIKNVSFSKYWIEQITVLESPEFINDLNKIIENFIKSQPQFIKNPNERNLYEFLKEKITPANISIYKLCQDLGFEKHYHAVLRLMLVRQQEINLEDFHRLIEELPVTNNLLAEIIKDYSQYPQVDQTILSLDVKYATKWLQSTQQESLRNIYLDSIGNDLLHQILFKINNASPDFLINLLSNELAIKKKMHSWKNYWQKAIELLNSRKTKQSFKAVDAFKEMIIEAIKTKIIGEELILDIGQLALFASRNFTAQNAESKDWLIRFLRLADAEEWFDQNQNQIVQNNAVRKYLKQGLESLGKSLDQDFIEKKYEPRIIYIVADIIDFEKQFHFSQNNFRKVAIKIKPEGLHRVR